MYCNKCGAPIDDGVRFCPRCGNELAEALLPAVYKTENNKRNKIIGIAAVTVAVLLIALIVLAIFGGRGYKKTVKEYMRCTIETQDGKTYVSLFPEEILGVSHGDKESIYNAAEKMLKNMKDDMTDTLGGIKDYKYKITDSERADGDDLREMKAELNSKYSLKISDMRDVEVTCRLTGENGRLLNLEYDFILVKSDGTWYIYGVDYEEAEDIL